MKIIADNHASEHHRPESRGGALSGSSLLDHIGGELRGVYGEVDHEPLPDALSALAMLLDRRIERGDQA